MNYLDAEQIMDLALLEAKNAMAEGDFPIGAFIVKENEIIAFAHNNKEKKLDISSHAEIEAIKIASKKLNRWDLSDCCLFVTLEPCLMCAGAIKQSRIKSIYYGAKDFQYGCESKYGLFSIKDNYTSPLVYAGIKETECKKILDEFFKNKRK